MKKLILTFLACLCMLTGFAGCSKDKTHWSYRECIKDIVNLRNLEEYDYEVKEIDHEYQNGDDEIHCFDITIITNDWSQRYCCYAVIDDGEVLYTDCDEWCE